MPTIRISTFNCENLFSRPKVMNFDDNNAAKKPLSEVVLAREDNAGGPRGSYRSTPDISHRPTAADELPSIILPFRIIS